MKDGWEIQPCGADDKGKIVNGLYQYNLGKIPALADTWTPLNYIVKDLQGNEIGGIISGIGYWNGLEIQVLWVAEQHRGRGVGTSLLRHVEEIAVVKGAAISMLDTFDFQAEKFYVKNGYEKIGEIVNFPKGHRRIYFSKTLS